MKPYSLWSFKEKLSFEIVARFTVCDYMASIFSLYRVIVRPNKTINNLFKDWHDIVKKYLISNRRICGFMSNSHKKIWTVSSHYYNRASRRWVQNAKKKWWKKVWKPWNNKAHLSVLRWQPFPFLAIAILKVTAHC